MMYLATSVQLAELWLAIPLLQASVRTSPATLSTAMGRQIPATAGLAIVGNHLPPGLMIWLRGGGYVIKMAIKANI